MNTLYISCHIGMSHYNVSPILVKRNLSTFIKVRYKTTINVSSYLCNCKQFDMRILTHLQYHTFNIRS